MNEWNKIKNFAYRFRDLGALGIGVSIANAIGAIFWFYMASLLGTEKYGEISYLLSIVVLTSTIALIGTPKAITVFVAKGDNIFPAIVLMVLSSSTIASAILFFVIVDDITLGIYIIGYVIFVLISSVFLGKKIYKKYSKIIILQKIFMVIAAIGLFYVMGNEGIILGIAISFFPFGFLIYKEIKNKKIDFRLLKSRYGFISNNYVLDITSAFSGSLDKIIIAPLLGFAILGNYQLGIQFMALLYIIPGTFFQYTLAHDATGNQNKSLKKMMIIFSVLLAIISITFIPLVLPTLYPKFTEAVEIIQIMSISIIPATITSTYVSKFLGINRSRLVMIGSGIFLGIQIPTIIILGEMWGANGAAVSIVLANIIQAIYYIFIDRYVILDDSEKIEC